MNETNDYEKARQECWDKIVEILPIMTRKGLDKVWETFDSVLDRAYQLGMEHAEADRDAEILKTHLRIERYLGEKRLQVAAMAMQGLLATNAQFQEDVKVVELTTSTIAKLSVGYADALLTELNKPKDERVND